MIATVEPDSPAVPLLENAKGLNDRLTVSAQLPDFSSGWLSESATRVVLDDVIDTRYSPDISKEDRQKLFVMLQRPDGRYEHWTGDLKTKLNIPPDTTILEHLEAQMKNRRTNKTEPSSSTPNP